MSNTEKILFNATPLRKIGKFIAYAFFIFNSCEAAHASTYEVSVSQGVMPTQLQVALSGQRSFCDFEFGPFVSDPTVQFDGNNINIASVVFTGECAPPVPGAPLEPPQPYSLSVNIPKPSDGVYQANFVISVQGMPLLPQRTYSRRFQLVNGGLPASREVDALSTRSSWLLATLLFVLAVWFRQKR